MSTATAIGERKSAGKTTNGGINWLRLGIEAGFLLTVAIAVAAVVSLMPAAREWLLDTLGLGWIAVGGFSITSLLLAERKPATLARGWRWWLVGAIATAVVVGGLAFMEGSSGALYAYGMSGEWGYALAGGGSAILAVVELLAALALVGLLVIPHGPRRYFQGIRYTGIGIRAGLVATGVGMRQVMIWLAIAATAARRFADRLADRRKNAAASVKPPTAQAQRPAPQDPSEETPAPAASPAMANLSRGSGWQLPPIATLAPAEAHQIDTAAIAGMSERIKEALAEHGVYVDVEDAKAGPRVIRFGLVPGYVPQKPGRDGEAAKQRPSRVRVGDITKRQKDLALALKSPYIRIIETPEPGEGLVGLEVPNPSPGKVLMRSIVERPEFGKVIQKGGLAFALGEDAGGQALTLDLAAMPHILIAGATGSGKSVCINSLVASLLMTRPPDELRMIMVDPKRVELTPFNGIPHLVRPVIVEPDDVQPALRGLINEMTRRYKLMEETGVRNIAGYNAKAGGVGDKGDGPMCFLVLIVDELADLMMTGGLEVEQQLVRLAQLGRAAGIHMVLATQRPSVKVVTGLLKANVPARVAFAVASQVDSRVILDTGGAEGLMGKGDLLLLNNDFPKARRGQGTLVYDEEMDRLIEFWRNQQGPPLPPVNLDDTDETEGKGGDGDSGETDNIYGGDILQQARDIALRNPRLNSAMLERRLKIRKSIADEIIEELRGEGLVIGG